MHELELPLIGIGEEHGVVAVAILRIVGRRIEDGGADRDEQLVQSIDIVAQSR